MAAWNGKNGRNCYFINRAEWVDKIDELGHKAGELGNEIQEHKAEFARLSDKELANKLNDSFTREKQKLAIRVLLKGRG